jgi:acyltransferase
MWISNADALNSAVGNDPRPARPVDHTGQRSGAIDAVRVLGIAAVVAGHTLGTPLVRPLLYSWHVPLFFFLAGYLFASRRTVTEELNRRTRTLAAPYLVWFVLIAIPFVVLDSTLETGTWARLVSPFLNGANSALAYSTFWFVAVLFFSDVLLRCVKKLPRSLVWAIGVVGAVLGYTIGGALAQTPLSIGSALPCLSFMLIGSLAHTIRPRIRAAAPVGFGLLLLAGVGIEAGVSAPLDIKQGDFGTPVISTVAAGMISFGLVLVAESIFSRLGPRASRIATQLSYAGFMVVLTHPLVLWLMLTFGPPAPGWLLFTICAAIPWAAALLAVRSPASLWLTGVDPARAKHESDTPSDSAKPT